MIRAGVTQQMHTVNEANASKAYTGGALFRGFEIDSTN